MKQEVFLLSRKYIGIDIGSFNIKLAVLEINSNEDVTVRTPCIVKTPRFLVQNGRLAEKEKLGELLKNSMEGLSAKPRNVVVVLGDSIAITRDIELPDVSRKEMDQMVRLNASEFLPHDSEDYVIRHRVLVPAWKNPKKANQIITVVVLSDLVSDFIEVFRNIGVKVSVIDSGLNSMVKYFQKIISGSAAAGRSSAGDSTEDDITNILIDLGASSTRMLIAKNDDRYYQQVLNYNSQRIDVLLANFVHMDRDVGEAFKIKFGLNYLYEYSMDQTARDIGQVINEQINQMMNDIYKNIQAFIARNGSSKSTRICLTGGMARMRGLSRYIEESFNIPCSVVQPDKTVKFPYETVSDRFPYYTNLIGAAYRGE